MFQICSTVGIVRSVEYRQDQGNFLMTSQVVLPKHSSLYCVQWPVYYAVKWPVCEGEH
jgi:hypothetical protein